MPTTRTPIKRSSRGGRITPLILDTYRRARDLHDNHDTETWEEDGGRRREYLDAASQLHSLLGRKPWQTCVMDCVDVETAPGYIREVNDWETARAILIELENEALQ
jgi:hypothetical protein